MIRYYPVTHTNLSRLAAKSAVPTPPPHRIREAIKPSSKLGLDHARSFSSTALRRLQRRHFPGPGRKRLSLRRLWPTSGGGVSLVERRRCPPRIRTSSYAQSRRIALA